MMKVIFLLYLIFCISFPIHGNTRTSVPLLPRPQKIEYHKGKYFFHLKDSCKIPSDKLSTQLTDTLSEVPLNQHEAYKLEVTPEHIYIKAVTPTGIYRAMQTLRQLMIHQQKTTSIPCCTITDWPAFRIRGFMQDVGRTYITLEELKKEIDLLRACLNFA